MSERENIFVRIKEALRYKAHAHHGHSLPTMAEQRGVMPTVGPTTEEQFALFAKNAAELKVTFKLVKDEAELATELMMLSAMEGWRSVATHNGPLAHLQTRALGLPIIVTHDWYDKHELEKCDVGISECDALIAQTGTVLVTSRSAGGRACRRITS